MILVFYGFSESEVKTSMNLQEYRQSRAEISVIVETVDPRSKWSEEIVNH